ncbi:MAG: C-terminal helicase domain-containing protein [Leucobacter sp.]|nr:C-terminal helicase domain-containing protein [Leucobacter sp.]
MPDLPEGVEHRVLIVLREHKDAALVQLARRGFTGDGSAAGSAPAARASVTSRATTPDPGEARPASDGAPRAPRTIVFCRTRAYTEHVTELLRSAGLRAVALHGDLSQARRERNLEKFVLDKADVLVATDVAARGIHVDDVELVLQADPPDDPKAYVHRAGRTGRVGGDGRLRPGTVLTVIPRTRQKRTRELFAALGFEPASFADYVPAGVS